MKKVKIFTFLFFSLSIIGIIMIYSSSSIWADFKTGNRYYFLIRQLIFFIIAVIAFFITSRLDYRLLKKYSNHIFIICIIGLILVLIPGIGIVRGGARSWIGLGDVSIQPSELMKIGMIIFTAKFISNNPSSMIELKNVFFYFLVLLFVFGLIMLEPDFGSGFILVVTIVLMMFVGRIKYKYVFLAMIGGIAAIVVMITTASYRMDRILSFLDPWQDPLGTGFQIIQSLFAIAPSGLLGFGLFNSRQKFFFLPEPQTDFIFAVILEELGMIGGAVIILLFFSIIYFGLELALNCKDMFAMYLSFGLISLLFIQVFINIAVVIGLIPVTGVTLPFLSYGGSSLVINFIMMGILVNIMKSNDIEEEIKYFRIRTKQPKIKKHFLKKKHK